MSLADPSRGGTLSLRILTGLVACTACLFGWTIGSFLWSYIRPTFVSLADALEMRSLPLGVSCATLLIALLPIAPGLSALAALLRKKDGLAVFLSGLSLLLLFLATSLSQAAMFISIVLPSLFRLRHP